ncbi:MAG: hypothetical protein CMH57_02635 [Myxococcales bacterium]|nr:hypothetical protein [Myxococcales bacterium]
MNTDLMNTDLMNTESTHPTFTAVAPDAAPDAAPDPERNPRATVTPDDVIPPRPPRPHDPEEPPETVSGDDDGTGLPEAVRAWTRVFAAIIALVVAVTRPRVWYSDKEARGAEDDLLWSIFELARVTQAIPIQDSAYGIRHTHVALSRLDDRGVRRGVVLIGEDGGLWRQEPLSDVAELNPRVVYDRLVGLGMPPAHMDAPENADLFDVGPGRLERAWIGTLGGKVWNITSDEELERFAKACREVERRLADGWTWADTQGDSPDPDTWMVPPQDGEGAQGGENGESGKSGKNGQSSKSGKNDEVR